MIINITQALNRKLSTKSFLQYLKASFKFGCISCNRENIEVGPKYCISSRRSKPFDVLTFIVCRSELPLFKISLRRWIENFVPSSLSTSCWACLALVRTEEEKRLF